MNNKIDHPSIQIVAIVLARGASKEIPRGDFETARGRSRVARRVAQALGSPSIGRVMLATDDREMAEVAAREGTEVVRLPAEVGEATLMLESALQKILDDLLETRGHDPELVALLQPVGPLGRPGDIEEAIEALREQGADSLFSARAVEGALWRRTGGSLRRQDPMESHVEENGSIYVFKPWVLRTHQGWLGGKVAVYLMDARDSLPSDLSRRSDSALGEGFGGIRRELADVSDLSGVRLLVLDFDGVMTDNRVLVDQDGRESVFCHRGDGFGLNLLKAAGLEVLVLSKERNPVVAARCRKLGIGFEQGTDDKLPVLQAMAEARRIGPEVIAYVGNDLNDVDCLGWVGFPIAVADALPTAVLAARWITRSPGGFGAVREVADAIMSRRRAP